MLTRQVLSAPPAQVLGRDSRFPGTSRKRTGSSSRLGRVRRAEAPALNREARPRHLSCHAGGHYLPQCSLSRRPRRRPMYGGGWLRGLNGSSGDGVPPRAPAISRARGVEIGIGQPGWGVASARQAPDVAASGFARRAFRGQVRHPGSRPSDERRRATSLKVHRPPEPHRPSALTCPRSEAPRSAEEGMRRSRPAGPRPDCPNAGCELTSRGKRG